MFSVVIPVYNGADVLGEQLEALAACRGSDAIEVIISDNGSTDASRDVATSFALGAKFVLVVLDDVAELDRAAELMR